MIDGAAAGLGEGRSGSAPCSRRWRPSPGRWSAPHAVRGGALRGAAPAAEGDPAAPRELLAVAAWAAAFGNEPSGVGGGARAPGARGEPRPTPDPGDLPSTWFSL